MIFYFSATGNSKYVADRIAAATGDKTISISDCCKGGVFSFDEADKTVGIVSLRLGLANYCSGVSAKADAAYKTGLSLVRRDLRHDAGTDREICRGHSLRQRSFRLCEVQREDAGHLDAHI